MKKYLIDTCIWIDLYENRKRYNNEPLGDYAWKLFLKIKNDEDKIIISDFLIRELEVNYSMEMINGMLKPFEKCVEKVFLLKEQKEEAKRISQERSIPKGGVIHSIIARDSISILISRNKHFISLKDISICYKPEDII